MNAAEKRFWWFVAVRQEIWKRRLAGKPWPWTKDPVLRDLTFTNVYRHLDRGTLYVAYEILENDDYSTFGDVLFNVLFYRRFNFVETHAELVKEMGALTLNNVYTCGGMDTIEKVLRARHGRGEKLCTGAYQSNLNPPLGGKDLAENLRRFAERYADFAWVKTSTVLTDSVQESFEAVRRATGIGDFLGYQVIGDLLTPAKRFDGNVLGLDPNRWAKLGPGARKAMKLLYPGAQGEEQVERARIMTELQHESFAEAGVEWRPLRPGCYQVDLTLVDIEHALCEFMKYDRAKHAGTSAKRKYRAKPENSWRPPAPVIPYYT